MDPETLARRFVDAYNSHQLEAQIELLFDPDVELVPLRAVLEDTVYRGHDGIRQLVRDIDESWSEAHIQILELEVRGEQAVSAGRLRLKGRSSGALTEVTGAAAWSVRNERLIRMAYHQTVQDARRELGWDN
jgi:ketosteroid isomerase-like protein